MEGKSSFLHVGLTVSDMDKIIDFYTRYFDFTVEHRGVFSPEFIAARPQLYKLENGVYSEFAFLKSPDGIVIELFCFSELVAAEPVVWNQPGYHHICLKVKSVPEAYQEMTAGGVEFFFEPAVKGDPINNQYWIFLKDPEGNMIELQD